MRRYRDADRLSTLVTRGAEVNDQLDVIAEILARFHRDAGRGAVIDDQARATSVWARWDENLTELARMSLVPPEQLSEVRRLASQYLSGCAELFAERIADGRIVDGHADLLADDIFCTPEDRPFSTVWSSTTLSAMSTASMTPLFWRWIWSFSGHPSSAHSSSTATGTTRMTPLRSL